MEKTMEAESFPVVLSANPNHLHENGEGDGDFSLVLFTILIKILSEIIENPTDIYAIFSL